MFPPPAVPSTLFPSLPTEPEDAGFERALRVWHIVMNPMAPSGFVRDLTCDGRWITYIGGHKIVISLTVTFNR